MIGSACRQAGTQACPRTRARARAASVLAGALVSALLASPATAGAGAPVTASLCEPGEAVQFSCPMGRGRLLSVCGQPPAALQYRFGKPKQIELRYPADAAQGPQQFLFAQYMRYQVDRIALHFTNEGTDYEVFDEREDGKRSAGVRVSKAGDGRETALPCRGPVTSRLGALKPLLRCDADSALQGGSCP
jgi:hypothetical protein